MNTFAAWMLAQEARALHTRLARLRPFALIEAMVPAAALQPRAQLAIERHLARGRADLETAIEAYLAWLASHVRSATAAEAQRRFTLLRLHFNIALTQFDLFSDVITQRSEHESGVWLAGLDAVAADALHLPGGYFEAPPLVCYLDRGAGAAIRRARTRLPGGGENPVAVVRVPRERMVGSGIASSLVHEVGHQAAALLDLVASLRPTLQALQRGTAAAERVVWQLWERWISEIVADFWAVARVGIASTLGLIAVVSLPRVFVFRLNIGDPHPSPWIRVLLSCSIGQALYPHAQWSRVAEMWASFYPMDALDAQRRGLFERLRAGMSALVGLLVEHRPRLLQGRSLGEVLTGPSRRPTALGRQFRAWEASPQLMYGASPSLVFAAIGQARMDGHLSPEGESELLGKLLRHWALGRSLRSAAVSTTHDRLGC